MSDLSLPELGDPSMDDDHAVLMQLILALRSAPLPQARSVLAALRKHARAHFQDEDETLRAHPCSNSQCHLDEHAAVLKSLDEVDQVLSQQDKLDVHQVALLSRLTTELLRWLPIHVSEMDAAVATQRMQARFGGTRIQIHRALRADSESTSIP